MIGPSLLRRCLSQRNFLIGLALTLLVLGAALVSLFWTPYPPLAVNVTQRLAGASAAHWFGTSSTAGKATRRW